MSLQSKKKKQIYIFCLLLLLDIKRSHLYTFKITLKLSFCFHIETGHLTHPKNLDQKGYFQGFWLKENHISMRNTSKIHTEGKALDLSPGILVKKALTTAYYCLMSVYYIGLAAYTLSYTMSLSDVHNGITSCTRSYTGHRMVLFLLAFDSAAKCLILVRRSVSFSSELSAVIQT